MISNSRIQRAILINWKGMFFQSFDIDPSMTILEGANGTGKTTIMIAVYTCLMPDLNYLNFQNVTTVSGRKNEDKGLYGRIGQDDKSSEEPIFSILDIITAKGNRVLIGVQFIKKTYPQVVLKHFAISNLAHDADVEQLLVNTNIETNQQEILEFDEIRDNCQQLNCDLVTFRHAKDYFRFLFDNEISPLRLVENEDRKKYNQLLHTSLYGGLSRSLHSSLRDYLLPENDKLVKGIQEMEQNLQTCRRTRSAIGRYQATREIIRSVYQTGLEMFSSAFFATRLDAEQKQKKALDLRKEKQSNKATWEEQSSQLIKIRDDQLNREERIRNIDREYDLAKEHLSRWSTAHKINTDISQKTKELEKQTEASAAAQQRFQVINDKLEEAQLKERQLADKQMELARQLSNAGQAWQELSKQVGLYQQATRLLEEAREKLDSSELSADNIAQWLEKSRQLYEESKGEHQKAYFELSEVKLKQDHFERFLALLEEITDEKVLPSIAGEKAREVLNDFFEFEKKIKEVDQIPKRLGEINENIRNQQRLFDGLKSVNLETIQSSGQFDQTRSEITETLKSHQIRLRETRQSFDQKSRELNQLNETLNGLNQKLGNWEDFQSLKIALEDRTARTINTVTELTDLRIHLEEQLQKVNFDKHEISAKQKRLQKTYNTLINEGSTKTGLKSLVDEGYGSLLADKYEEIPLEWAANLESRLGPLTEALVVKDIHKAANELSGAFDRPDEIWLVEESLKEKMPEALELGDSILVKHGDAWRLKRLPEVPVLGKEARGSKLETYGLKIKQLSHELEKNEQTTKSIKESQNILNKLLVHSEFVESGSPVSRINDLKKQHSDLDNELEKLKFTEQRLSDQIEQLENQEDIIRRFYPIKELLNVTDLKDQYQALEEQFNHLEKKETEVRDKRSLYQQLQQGLEFLQHPSFESLEALEKTEHQFRQIMEHQRQAFEVLNRLNEAQSHFQYKDQVTLLEEKESINQHLEKGLTKIETELKSHKAEIEDYTQEMKRETGVSQREQARLNTLKGQLELLQQNLEELGVSDFEKGLQKGEEEVELLAAKKEKLEKELNQILEQRYRLEAEIKQVQDSGKRIASRLKSSLSLSRPSVRKWHAFHSQAKHERNYHRLLADYYGTVRNTNQQPERYWRNVSASQATLLAILENIHDARAVLSKIREITAVEDNEADPAETCLSIWRQLLVYLNQVIPVDLQTDDPEKAQETITQKLETLNQNLEQQERSLRTHVHGIPSHINAEIRKQKSRIRKLNQKLESVKFGFLQSIRINIETQPKLKRFLSILPQQLDIFSEAGEENVSIETLMADLYEREGAGKVKGDLLLDYRHYVGLGIEVKREGNEEYEKVTSTNLSTGESIGVGIAVLIMVLMSWEEQSLHPSESENRGSVRFLLLDESSRLDQKALQTLTDFCQQLKLQLLIAAPSVERSLRGTTHHLTRGYFDGREEVIVRGRRITGPIN